MNFQSTKIRIYLITQKFKNNKVSQPKRHCFLSPNPRQKQERKAWDLSINAIPAAFPISRRKIGRIFPCIGAKRKNHLPFHNFPRSIPFYTNRTLDSIYNWHYTNF